MKIKNVKITGFRAFQKEEDSTFDFTNKGEIVNFASIYAPNGFGKTSFYDAVEWCLTHKIQRFDRMVDFDRVRKDNDAPLLLNKSSFSGKVVVETSSQKFENIINKNVIIHDNVTITNSIIESNKTRKDFIASEISRSKSNVIGFYKLAMKKDSDNSRYSAIIDIMMKLKSNGFELLIYDPSIKNDSFEGINVLQDFDVFKKTSDIIVCNRNEKNLDDVKQKVFTRDVFGIN